MRSPVRWLLAVLVMLVVGAVSHPGIALAQPAQDAQPAKGTTKHRYVVQTTTKASARTSAARVTVSGGQVHRRYRRAIHGFTATLTRAQAARLARRPGVVAVTRDRRSHASTTQVQPTWGLDRIDQHPEPLNGTYSYDTTGAGVTVFVIDSGIRASHRQFGGRASSGYDFVDRDRDASDCYGHGTHVAGTIGGKDYGAAKGVDLVSLRVFDCEGRGWLSDIIAAIDWAIAHQPHGRSVINISGGGLSYPPLDDAVDRAVAADIPVVVAAMNDNTDACTASPAGAPQAITVAAVDRSNLRAGFSDFGSCVDLFAPGVDVLSALNTSDTATAYDSGTSMATPHVTGAVARTLQARPTLSATGIAARLARTATVGVVNDAQDSPNRLLYVSAHQRLTNT